MPKNHCPRTGAWPAGWKFCAALMLLLVGVGSLTAAQPSKGDPKAGKARYDMLCASCHGSEGKGNGPAAGSLNPRPADLSDPDYIKTLSDKYLFEIIKEGGPRVKKSPFMPAWGSALNDREIWNLIAYLKSLSN